MAVAAAAPSTETPSREADNTANPAGGLLEMPGGVSEGQGNSKTVRMLLELQNSPPPLEGTADSHRGESKPKTNTAQAGSNELNSAPGAPAEVSQGPAVDWRSGLPGRTVNSQRADAAPTVIGREAAAGNRESRQAADDRIDVKGLLPPHLVAFLRENRDWVLLASLGLLATVWLAASAMSPRRH